MSAKQHYNNKKILGFTLIELIVVVAIMAILGVIFTDILIQAIRGQNKIKAINAVKQNGQVVMDKLSNEIRQAEKLVCIGKSILSPVDNTIVTYNGGVYSRYRLISPQPISNPTQNGVITRNDFSDEFIVRDVNGNFNEQDLCTVADITSTPLTNLSDTNTVSGVSLNFNKNDLGNSQPVFSKTASSEAGFGETIIIQFSATSGVGAGYTYDVTLKEGGILFKTAVGIRGGQR
jgi:prepilin-type N-terminal cleavage/methylation domain-containing protein